MSKTNQSPKRDAEKRITVQLTTQQVANAIGDYLRGPLGLKCSRCSVSLAASSADRFGRDIEIDYQGFNCTLVFEEGSNHV